MTPHQILTLSLNVYEISCLVNSDTLITKRAFKKLQHSQFFCYLFFMRNIRTEAHIPLTKQFEITSLKNKLVFVHETPFLKAWLQRDKNTNLISSWTLFWLVTVVPAICTSPHSQKIFVNDCMLHCGDETAAHVVLSTFTYVPHSHNQSLIERLYLFLWYLCFPPVNSRISADKKLICPIKFQYLLFCCSLTAYSEVQW
jgi:hypothetical protein